MFTLLNGRVCVFLSFKKYISQPIAADSLLTFFQTILKLIFGAEQSHNKTYLIISKANREIAPYYFPIQKPPRLKIDSNEQSLQK